MAQGCTPPGVVFPSIITTSVVPRFTPGAMEADPFICTAPASSDGLATRACQLLLRVTSVAFISTADFCWNMVQAPSVSAVAKRAKDLTLLCPGTSTAVNFMGFSSYFSTTRQELYTTRGPE